ncbi:MAG: zf-HC2 domain-containing protein [Burkholderiales bacterium]|nr:zf-HC2 domain-containing protein [Burkholderiales bacterium]
MMKCNEAARAISDGLDRKLNLVTRMQLRMHLFICHYCSDFFTQSRFLRQAAKQDAARKSATEE